LLEHARFRRRASHPHLLALPNVTFATVTCRPDRDQPGNGKPLLILRKKAPVFSGRFLSLQGRESFTLSLGEPFLGELGLQAGILKHLMTIAITELLEQRLKLT